LTRKQNLESQNGILSAQNEGLKKAGENIAEIFNKAVENYMKRVDASTNRFVVNIAKSGKVLEKRVR
jgi:hypothetical protein